METNRVAFDGNLREICENVYFQPSTNVKLKYPCIVYKLKGIENEKADNKNYVTSKEYEVIIIDKISYGTLPDLLNDKFTKAKFSNHYVSDNLYHYVFNIYN